jgi:uncharacterized protein YggT (Ycf19 family)
MSFLKMVIAASIGQIAVLIIVQGFSNSYFGRNAKEEVSRWFDQLSKHMTKNKEKNNG